MHFIVAFVVFGFKKIFYMITNWCISWPNLASFDIFKNDYFFFLKGRFIINDQTKNLYRNKNLV